MVVKCNQNPVTAPHPACLFLFVLTISLNALGIDQVVPATHIRAGPYFEVEINDAHPLERSIIAYSDVVRLTDDDHFREFDFRLQRSANLEGNILHEPANLQSLGIRLGEGQLKLLEAKKAFVLFGCDSQVYLIGKRHAALSFKQKEGWLFDSVSHFPKDGNIILTEFSNSKGMHAASCLDTTTSRVLWRKEMTPGWDQDIYWLSSRFIVSIMQGRVGSAYKIFDVRKKEFVAEDRIKGWIRAINGHLWAKDWDSGKLKSVFPKE